MPIEFNCHLCGRLTRVADDLAGRRIRCPGCREATTVPTATTETEDVPEEQPHMRPVRRSRRPFEEESAREETIGVLPDPAGKSLTLDNRTHASNPGGLRVSVLKYWSSFPIWPTIWFVATAGMAVTGVFWWPGWIGFGLCGILLMLYWIRVREHFRHGCTLPAIVISVEKQLIAVSTDLSTGEGSYPAVRILHQPLSRMTGGPPQKHQRLAAVALYEADPKQNDHWASFHPKVVNCVSADPDAIDSTLKSIQEEDWNELLEFLERIPRRSAGLHKMW